MVLNVQCYWGQFKANCHAYILFKHSKTTLMALCLKIFFSMLVFFTLERFHKPEEAFETYGWKLLKINYWLYEIIDKAQDLNFNQSSLIGCLGLNLDSVVAFFPWQSLTQASFLFDSWVLIDNWKILLLYAWWLQQFLADGFNTVSPHSVRQANTCHLWISCTALMVFSAPTFWGFFEFFYHKKVSQYPPLNDTVKSLNLIFNSKQHVFCIKTVQ